MYLSSSYMIHLLVNFSKNENISKEAKNDNLIESVVRIMKVDNLYLLQKQIEHETKYLLDCLECKLIYFSKANKGMYRYTYSYSKDKDTEFTKEKVQLGGIAALTIQYENGIYCKHPNHDDCYNPTIDIVVENSSVSFYSIPLKYQTSIFAVLQFTIINEEINHNCSSKEKTHHISKLNFYQEKLIDSMNDTIIHVVEKMGVKDEIYN